MQCKYCSAFLSDYIDQPISKLSTLYNHVNHRMFHRHTFLLHLWMNRLLERATPPVIRAIKEMTDYDLMLEPISAVTPDRWNKTFYENLVLQKPDIFSEMNDFDDALEEAGFAKGKTGRLFFLQQYCIPLLLVLNEIHTEHNPQKKQIEAISIVKKQVSWKELREEYGNLYD